MKKRAHAFGILIVLIIALGFFIVSYTIPKFTGPVAHFNTAAMTKCTSWGGVCSPDPCALGYHEEIETDCGNESHCCVKNF